MLEEVGQELTCTKIPTVGQVELPGIANGTSLGSVIGTTVIITLIS